MNNQFHSLNGGIEYTCKDPFLVLVIYDISNTKRRNALIKILKGYGVRVQKSAFECYMNEKQYNMLISQITRFAQEEDFIRVYKLRGQTRILDWGGAGSKKPEEVLFF